MLEKIKKNLWTLMAVLIVVCIGIIAFSEYRYLSVLRDTLEDNELQHMMDVAQTQKNALDSYLSEDQERLHNCAVYLSQTPVFGSIQEMLIPFLDTSAEEYTVICFDEGVAYSSLHDEIIRLTQAQLEEIGSFTGSGMRDDFVGLFTGERGFSCYENFTFNSGHHGMIQKRYNWDALSDLFGLSVRDSQSYGYLLDKSGNILCRSDLAELNDDNIFDEFIDRGCSQETLAGLRAALSSGKAGSDTLTIDSVHYAYSYVPLESASGWYLFSIVPMEDIETDVDTMMATLGMSLVTIPLLLAIGCMLFMLARNNNKRGRDIAAKNLELDTQSQALEAKERDLAARDQELYDQGQALKARDRDIAGKNRELAAKDRELAAKEKELDAQSEALKAKDRDLAARDQELDAQSEALKAKERDIAARDKDLMSREKDIAGRDRELAAKDRELAAKDRELAEKDRDIVAKDKDIKEKEQRLEYEARMFEAFAAYLSSSSNDVYLILNEDWEVVYAAPNLEQVMHRSAAEIVASIRSAGLPTDSEEVLEFLRQLRTLKPGQSAGPVIREQTDPLTGERQYLLEQATCVHIQDRTKIVLYVADRTRTFKSREHLAEAMRQAQDANNAKSEFLRSVSHDMRTPMNAIIGFLGLMRNEMDDPGAVREYTRQIDTAAQHLLGLINNVLDMSKVESGDMRLKIADLNLAEMIEEVKTTITPQVQAKNQTFEVSVSQLMHEHLRGDKTRIKAILLNLLSNAVKYTPDGGAIRLRVKELPQAAKNFCRIQFKVEDNGVGMSQDYQNSDMFSPFSREDTPANRETEGSGLGLAVAKGLLDLMGGGIHVKSAPGKGSTFTVELDMRILPQDVNPKFWIEHQVRKMIIVDDDEATCQVIVNAMSKSGVSTDYATDGETALRMVSQQREAGNPYDLILMDWMMPGMSGLEIVRHIRKDDQTPVCLLTAYNWDDIKQEATEIGVNDFMPKPFFMSTFKEVVQRMMACRKQVEKSDAPTDVIRGKHVMVVDDIEINRIVLTKIMSTLGAQCDTAANGQEALEKFEKSQPGEYDLILMDLQMPVLDGCGATRAIRVCDHPSAKSIPIIAVTANAFSDDVRNALDSGMNAHIAKPIQTDQLKSLIQQVLGS